MYLHIAKSEFPELTEQLQFFYGLIRECFTTAAIADLLQYLYHFSNQFSAFCAMRRYTPCLCDGMAGAPDLVIDFNLTDEPSDIAGIVGFILPVHISVSRADLSQPAENSLMVQIERNINTDIVICVIGLFLSMTVLEQRIIHKPGLIYIKCLSFGNWMNIKGVMLHH